MQSQCGFTGRFRPVYFGNPATGNSANTKRGIQRDGTGGYDINIDFSPVTQTHNRTFAKITFNLRNGYVNGFYFIIVFCLFTFQESREAPLLSTSETLLCTVLVLLGFYFFIRGLFGAFERKCLQRPDTLHTFSTRHAQVMGVGTVAALCTYAGIIYLLDFKSILTRIPIVAVSECALNTLGLLPFFAMLLIVWGCAFPAYQKYYDHHVSLKEYLDSHVRMNGSIVVPTFDSLPSLVNAPKSAAFTAPPAGGSPRPAADSPTARTSPPQLRINHANRPLRPAICQCIPCRILSGFTEHPGWISF